MQIYANISVFFDIPFLHQQINSNKTMFSHEGIKYTCRHCGKEFSKKGHLAEHRRAVHDRIKYSCGKCEYQATSKGHLAQHQREVHEGVN